MSIIASDGGDIPRLVKTLTTREVCVALYGYEYPAGPWHAVKVNAAGELVVAV